MTSKNTGESPPPPYPRRRGRVPKPTSHPLGSVIRDMLNPDLVLIGEFDARSGDILVELYRGICESRPAVARISGSSRTPSPASP